MIPKILFGTLTGESLPKTGSTKPKPVPYLVERIHRYNDIKIMTVKYGLMYTSFVL